MTAPPVAAALVVGVILLATACWFALSRARPPYAPTLALLAAGAAWAPVNKPIEGPTLITLRPENGLTIADTAVPVVILGAVAWRLVRRIAAAPALSSVTPPPTAAPVPTPASFRAVPRTAATIPAPRRADSPLAAESGPVERRQRPAPR